MKFKENDIIQKLWHPDEVALVRSHDDLWYYVSWLGAGDGMMYIKTADKNYKKIMDFEPGSMDDLVFSGKVQFRK